MKTVIVDEECKYVRDCEPDEIGLVVVRGPNVFPGYLESARDYEAWVDDGDGQGAWLSTGDLGRVDADGYFWLTGRQKELILRGGHNIDPQLIEGPLHSHPAVALAAAVGRPHHRIGEQPVVYVQLKAGAKTSEADLLAYATQHADERAAAPKDIRVVAELPQTAVGKVFKPQLWWWEIEDVFARDVRALEGVASVAVKAGPHPTHGTLAEVEVELQPGVDSYLVEEQIGEVLGRYAVAFTVSLGPSS
jgi:fatty-acyl-CoA synthase